MLIFLDCEYTDAIQCDLISIGMVSGDGQHSFYAERKDYEQGWCNSFVQHCILSLLDASNVVTREELTAQFRTWFAFLPRQVVIACDDHTDWDLFLDAFDGEFPPNVVRPFKNLRHLIDTTVYNEAVCCYHDQPKHPWHHALHDAKAHRAGWLAWADVDKIKKGRNGINQNTAQSCVESATRNGCYVNSMYLQRFQAYHLSWHLYFYKLHRLHVQYTMVHPKCIDAAGRL